MTESPKFTHKTITDIGFTLTHHFLYADINVVDIESKSDVIEYVPHAEISIKCDYKPSSDPNDLDLYITDVSAINGYKYPVTQDNFYALFDMEEHQWVSILDNLKGFPDELSTLTNARYVNICGICSSNVQEFADLYPNLFRLLHKKFK